MLLYNAHCHTKAAGAVQNLFPEDAVPGSLNDAVFFSCGLHPWYIKKDYRRQLLALEKKVSDSRIIAVGECGLDRLRGAPFTRQKEVFQKQVELAATAGKPLIIHCVKAYAEVICILKKVNPGVAVMLHRFNGSPEVAASFLPFGGYFSLAPDVLDPARVDSLGANKKKSLLRLIRMVNINNILIETDDFPLNPGRGLAVLSYFMSQEPRKLAEIINNNFRIFFGL